MYRIAQIQTEDLKRLRDKNGIAFLDCDIPPLELINMINEAFTYGGILLDNSELKEVLSFRHDGKVDLLLPFDHVKLDSARIVIWQMMSYNDCHGVFFSDYTTEDISHKIQSFMRRLQHHPSAVSSFFLHPLLSYLCP